MLHDDTSITVWYRILANNGLLRLHDPKRRTCGLLVGIVCRKTALPDIKRQSCSKIEE